MPQCKCCAMAVDDSKAVTCAICKAVYNPQCVDLTNADIKVLRSKRSIKWNCENCSAFYSDICSLKSIIVGLQQEIRGLKSQINDIVDKPNSNPSYDNVDVIINEINDIRSRENNIIIFNVTDESGEDNDMQIVKRIINETTPDLNNQELVVNRLGKKLQGKSRPLKVTFGNMSNVQKLLRNCYKLQHSNEFRTIRISKDLTVMQRSHAYKIRQEYKDRISKGETNIKLKYFNGLPKIVVEPRKN